MQNVQLAFELSLEGRDLKGASANQGSIAILNIHYIGAHMVLKITEIVSPLWGMALTPNLRLGREAGLGGVT
uniref:Uncharacterized protein n=1 Tax=Salix viminalis TaxID=40686 RepID=A0A6N2L3R5_SALVM